MPKIAKPKVLHPILADPRLKGKPGALADVLYDSVAARLEIQKVANAIADQESRLKTWFIENLPKSEATGVSGELANVRVYPKTIAQVDDWPKFLAWVVKNKAYECITRKANDSAIQERWEAGERVPGVKPFGVVKVGVTKR